MRTRFSADDDGFTLVEVVIALALLLVLATGFISFTVEAMSLAVQQQRAQVAVTVAGERMESVQRLTTSNALISTLVAGRSAAEVTLAHSEAADVPGVDTMYPAWGTVVAGAPATIPVTQTTTRSGSDYHSTVLIGTCYQPVLGGECERISGATTDPGPLSAVAAGKSRLIRVVVVVRYVGACAGAGECSYTTAALFDTKGDLVWRVD